MFEAMCQMVLVSNFLIKARPPCRLIKTAITYLSFPHNLTVLTVEFLLELLRLCKITVGAPGPKSTKKEDTCK